MPDVARRLCWTRQARRQAGKQGQRLIEELEETAFLWIQFPIQSVCLTSLFTLPSGILCYSRAEVRIMRGFIARLEIGGYPPSSQAEYNYSSRGRKGRTSWNRHKSTLVVQWKAMK